MVATKVCIALLFDNLDTDSRAQRHFRSLAKFYDCEVLVESRSRDTVFPFRVKKTLRPFQKRKWNFLFFFLHSFLRLVRKRPDVVFAEGLFPLIPASLYCTLFKKKLIYDSRELYLKDAHGNYSYTRFHCWIEKRLIGSANLILSANEPRAELILNSYKLVTPPLVVQNIPPQKESIPASPPPEFSYLFSQNQFLIYQGNLGQLRGVDRFVQTLPYLPKKVHLILIVRGEKREKLISLSQNLGVTDRIHIHDLVEHHVLYSVLKSCHLGIISYELRGLNNELCAPNKLYEYAQCVLPMITSPQSLFHSLFSQYGIGKAIDRDTWEKNDFKGMAQVIEAMMSEEKNENEFKRFNEVYNWKKEEDKILQSLEVNL